MYATMMWRNGELDLLDQTLLPGQTKYITCDNYLRVKEAIQKLEVRGAPAIGAAAAFAMVMGAREVLSEKNFLLNLALVRDNLISARPTAVNLAWACHKLYNVAAVADSSLDLEIVVDRMEDEAVRIYTSDIRMNKKMGEYGAEVVPKKAVIITHCNAGALATCGWGTALGVIRSAYAKGKVRMVFADETRPLLQGARLTTYELIKDKIPVTLITDGMAAWAIKTKGVNFAITGADRIALNGDVANKIGTFGLALVCRAQGVPFYVAAPVSTFDFTCPSGRDIPIEVRSADEIKMINGKPAALEEVKVFNPAFDVTPAALITGIITEYGVLSPPFAESIVKLQKQVHGGGK